MDIGSLLLIFALAIGVALFIGRPVLDRRSFSRHAIAVSQAEHEQSALLAERDRIIRLLQELDFDHSLGKIPEEDYPAQRNLLLQRGAEIWSQLDADQLEKAIASRRAQQKQPATQPHPKSNGLHTPDDALEQQIASRRRQQPEKTGGFCPKCGKPIQKSDKFCPKCGAQV